MENRTTYATHTEIVAANQLIVVQHPRATDIGWSTLFITTKCKHVCVTHHIATNEHYSTYGTRHPLTTNSSFTRTSVQRAPTAMTLFPLSTTLSLEQCTSSCLTFPLRRAVGFIYVSTRNTIEGGKIFIRVLPVSSFSPCDAPGISRYPHPEGELCTIIKN